MIVAIGWLHIAFAVFLATAFLFQTERINLYSGLSIAAAVVTFAAIMLGPVMLSDETTLHPGVSHEVVTESKIHSGLLGDSAHVITEQCAYSGQTEAQLFLPGTRIDVQLATVAPGGYAGAYGDNEVALLCTTDKHRCLMLEPSGCNSDTSHPNDGLPVLGV